MTHNELMCRNLITWSIIIQMKSMFEVFFMFRKENTICVLDIVRKWVQREFAREFAKNAPIVMHI